MRGVVSRVATSSELRTDLGEIRYNRKMTVVGRNTLAVRLVALLGQIWVLGTRTAVL